VNTRHRAITLAVCAIGVTAGLATWTITSHDTTPTVEGCATAIGDNFNRPKLPAGCRGLSDTEQRAALVIALERANSVTPSLAADTPSAAPIPHAEFGKPIDIDGHFTIAMTRPVDATDRFQCALDGVVGPCPSQTALVDVTVVATDAVDLGSLFIGGSTPDGYSITGTAVGGQTMQPGATHVTRGLELQYDEGATALQAQLWLTFSGYYTGGHLAEWSWDGR